MGFGAELRDFQKFIYQSQGSNVSIPQIQIWVSNKKIFLELSCEFAVQLVLTLVNAKKTTYPEFFSQQDK